MSKGTHNLYYQKIIEQAINKSLGEFKRLSIFRIDLRSSYGRIDYKDDHKVITQFLDSLKLRIKTDVKNKSLLWKRNLNVNVDSIWVREVGDINCKVHYHVSLFLNKDIYYSTGHYHEGNNLARLIINAWNSALGLVNNPSERLVHFSGYYHIDQGKTYYFVKYYTKSYHDGYRCFGCSQ